MLLGTLKALIYVRFSTYMWTLTLQYVDTYLARFFNMWTLTLQTLTEKILSIKQHLPCKILFV